MYLAVPNLEARVKDTYFGWSFGVKCVQNRQHTSPHLATRPLQVSASTIYQRYDSAVCSHLHMIEHPCILYLWQPTNQVDQVLCRCSVSSLLYEAKEAEGIDGNG